MITLEGYEIEEMRSINHIMTVELQFKTPVTQEEARHYLSRILAKAYEMSEIANDNHENVNEAPKSTNDEAFDAAVKAEFAKAKKPKKEKPKKEDSEGKPRRTKIDWDKACALKKAGWSNDEIATEVHAPVGTINSVIYQRMKEYNEGKRVNRCEEVETEEV